MIVVGAAGEVVSAVGVRPLHKAWASALVKRAAVVGMLDRYPATAAEIVMDVDARFGIVHLPQLAPVADLVLNAIPCSAVSNSSRLDVLVGGATGPSEICISTLIDRRADGS